MDRYSPKSSSGMRFIHTGTPPAPPSAQLVALLRPEDPPGRGDPGETPPA